MDDAPTNLVALREGRQRAEALVAQRYGEDLIDADQLDRRMERIANAQSMAQLESEIRDIVDPGTSPAMALVGLPAGSLAPRASASTALVPDQRTLTCVFSAIDGPGQGLLARHTTLNCLFGSAELDLREHPFGPGATVLDLRLAIGSVEIQVPKGLPVIVETSLVLAGVDRAGMIPGLPSSPDEPHLRIIGFAFMASIEIEERLPDESPREARRRRRRERKLAKAERKRLARGR